MATKVLLGNEAIVKGALAAGVDFVSGYPGCPSAEIGDEFGKIAKENGVYAEWSVNEKVALEAAIGASFSGLKSLVNMKSFGINVCSDSLLPLAYTGTKGPMVIIVADDPSCHSSAQSEQDSRGYGYLSRVPVLDPSDAQECYDFTKLGFEISEKFNTPVILRTTTRVAHQRASVVFETSEKRELKKGQFVKNPHQFSTMPPRVMEMKGELLDKIKKIKIFAEKSKINPIRKSSASNGVSKIGIITSGVSYLYVMEALEQLDIKLPVLKLGFFYPLPERLISNFIKGKEKILVAEELDPYLEKEIIQIAKDINPKAEIRGKNLLTEIGELNTEKIILALSKITGQKLSPALPGRNPALNSLSAAVPRRYPRLCAGCPYWYIFPTIKRIAPDGTIFGGDIGCNMIAGLPPHNIQDYLFSMGASMGISHGVSKGSGQKVISIIGDGTFFHAGIPGLINAVYNKSNPLIVVLDNRITAMTGHQQNPGMGKTAMGDNVEELKIEDIAKSCGVKYIKVLDQINIHPVKSASQSEAVSRQAGQFNWVKELEESIKDFLNKDEVSMIICRRICALLVKSQNEE